MNSINTDAGFAALDTECALRARELATTHAAEGLTVPEQMAIPINMLALIICGLPEMQWEDTLESVYRVLRDNVRNAEVTL